MLRIDLGCGTKKQPGFIGVDRYPLTGVDIVADMNRALPFHDDSVDLLLASHSLEHVEKLLATMREVYRICKHGTQLCVIAPYNEQKLNWANPYHTCVFNEHTPRFWTDYPHASVDQEEYDHPHASTWGLSKTDNSNPGIDIRIVSMECFYFPKYDGLPPSEKRRLRQERTDVCEQIMYHLIVWKGDAEGQGRSFDDYVADFQPYEPEYITQQRNRGQEILLQNSADTRESAHASVAGDAGEPQSKGSVELSAYLDRQKTVLEQLRVAHGQQHSTLSAACEAEGEDRVADVPTSERLRQELTTAKDEAIHLRAHLVSLTGEIARLHEVLGRLQADLQESHAAHQQQPATLPAARESCTEEAYVSERLRQELTGAKDEANQLRAHSVSLTGEITRLHEHCAAQTEALGRLITELHDTAAYNRILRDDAVRMERELEFAGAELRRESAAAAASQEEVSSLVRRNQDLKANQESNDVLRAKLALTRAELETTTTLLGLLRQTEEGLSGEITTARREAAAAVQEAERWKILWSAAKRSLSAIAVESRIPEFAQVARVGGFIIGRDRQIQRLPSGFGPLREYCDRHFRTARACIVLGGDLTEVPYREYVIPFALDRLTSVSLAIRPLVPESPGILGIEIVSARSEILAHVRGELSAVHRDGVTEVPLPAPLNGLQKNWLLRVFVRDAGTPVSVYELVRSGLFQGITQSFPLVSFS
jgi:Methyltransferase domain